MNVAEVKKKIKNKRISEIIWKIDHHQVKSDEEWLEFSEELNEYARSDIPEDIKRLFYPLGYLEMTTIIVDGILRWRNSICANCRKQRGYEKHSCAVYQMDDRMCGGIPNEIWAHKNVTCPYFEA